MQLWNLPELPESFTSRSAEVINIIAEMSEMYVILTIPRMRNTFNDSQEWWNHDQSDGYSLLQLNFEEKSTSAVIVLWYKPSQDKALYLGAASSYLKGPHWKKGTRSLLTCFRITLLKSTNDVELTEKLQEKEQAMVVQYFC